MISTRRTPVCLFAGILILAPSLFAQGEKKALPIDDYGRWRSIGSVALADNGDWITFGYSKRESDAVLHIKNLDTDKAFEIERGTNPQLSDDSRWVAYFLNVPFAEAEKLREGNKPVPRKAELMSLETGEKTTWDNVATFVFSKGSQILAVKKTKADRDAKHGGTNLILRHLHEDYEELLGSVGEFSFNKPGTILSYTVDAADKNGNGLYMVVLGTGVRRPLDNGKADYARLTWDEEGTALAVLKGKERKSYEEKENTLLTFTGLDRGIPVRVDLEAGEAFDFPKDMVISEKAALSWNQGANKVFFGIKKQYAKPDEKKADDEKKNPIANVDIWHWQDELIQSVQMVRAGRDRNRTDRAVFNLPVLQLEASNGNGHLDSDAKPVFAPAAKPFVRLMDDTIRSVEITRDGRWGVGQDDREYVSDWQERKADFYRIDTATGERTLMFKAQGRTMGLSPASDVLLYWQDGQIRGYDLPTGENYDLTGNSPVSFVNEEFDRPGEKPAYGVTGWAEDGSGIILTHKYDLWLQPFGGSPAVNLTGGVGSDNEIRFRYVNTDPEERFIDLGKPLLLSAYGQWTKKAGFYRLANGALEELIYADKSFGRAVKAKNADRFIYTVQSFRDFPDYYVSDGSFASPKRVTDGNPQQVEYRWGSRILFDYTNSDGVRLQGTLAVPDGHKKGQKLPMLVNFYEKNSQNLHRYPAPRYASSPQFAGFVSNGYLVMQPDIHFRTGRSHSDMLECVEAAVKKVIEMGYADPDRVALHGHSYSGQGSAFISTRSDMFAAIVAGAAATNLVSDFNQLWKSAGTNQHRYDIYGQGRFGTNPFDDPELYEHESAVFSARSMNTPLMLLHGTDDGSVEWLQAVEFYNALRFNDKPVILLSYPGEGHGLRKFENQKDFQVRMREFFDHHLKGAPAPEWMTRGRSFLEKERVIKNGK